MSSSDDAAAIEALARQIRGLISNDDLDPALEQTRDLSIGGPGELADEAIVLSGRLAGLNRRVRQGVVSAADAQVERVQIAKAAQALLAELIRKLTPADAPVPAPAGPAGPSPRPRRWRSKPSLASTT
jgi:hypothetical protein